MKTVIVDTQVVYHLLAARLAKWDLEAHLKATGETQVALVTKIVQANICHINSGLFYPGETKFVWVDDFKDNGKYWRHDYLADPEVWMGIPGKPRSKRTPKALEHLKTLVEKNPRVPLKVLCITKEDAWPVVRQASLSLFGSPKDLDEMYDLVQKLMVRYKGGRGLPTYHMQVIRKAGADTLRAIGAPVLKTLGFEADDQASLLVRVNRASEAPQDLVLLTIDTDWMGLIDHGIDWVCTKGYEPRVRKIGDGSVNTWANRVLKATLGHPRDIWEHKAQFGDSSDNLPPGSPIGVIDLLNPVPEYDLFLRDSERHQAKEALGQQVNPGTQEKGLEALRYLSSLGAKTTGSAIGPVVNPMYT